LGNQHSSNLLGEGLEHLLGDLLALERASLGIGRQLIVERLVERRDLVAKFLIFDSVPVRVGAHCGQALFERLLFQVIASLFKVTLDREQLVFGDKSHLLTELGGALRSVELGLGCLHRRIGRFCGKRLGVVRGLAPHLDNLVLRRGRLAAFCAIGRRDFLGDPLGDRDLLVAIALGCV